MAHEKNSGTSTPDPLNVGPPPGVGGSLVNPGQLTTSAPVAPTGPGSRGGPLASGYVPVGPAGPTAQPDPTLQYRVEGAELVPSGWMPSQRAKLQGLMREAGILNNFSLGVWDSASASSYREVLNIAIFQGQTVSEVLDQMIRGKDLMQESANRGPTVISQTHPDDIKVMAHALASRTIGRKLTDAEANSLVGSFQELQRAAQLASIAQGNPEKDDERLQKAIASIEGGEQRSARAVAGSLDKVAEALPGVFGKKLKDAASSVKDQITPGPPSPAITPDAAPAEGGTQVVTAPPSLGAFLDERIEDIDPAGAAEMSGLARLDEFDSLLRAARARAAGVDDSIGPRGV